MDALAEVLAVGAAKYGERNWERGIHFSRLFSAALRHLFAWWRGEDCDPETGLCHLSHALCNVVFLVAFVRRGQGAALDNRHRGENG